MFSEYIAGIIVLLLLLYYLKKPKKWLKNVPGPKPNILFGNLLEVLTPWHKFLSILTGFTRKYGKTFKLQIGPFKEVLFTSDIKLVEFILSSTKIIEKSSQYKAAQKWVGNSLFVTTAVYWKNQRRMLNPSFHISILSRYIDVFEKNGSVLAKKIENEVGKDSVDIYLLMNLCTLDIICEAAMGTSINAQTNGESEFVSSLASITDFMLTRTFLPMPDWLYRFTPMYYWEKRILRIYHSFIEGVIDKRIENLKNEDDDKYLDEKKRPDFLDLLLKSEVDGRPLDRIEIRDQVGVFMFGAQDTTASSLSFILYCLAHHPDVQEKAYEEQKMLFGDNIAPEMAIRDLQEMKYLETVIKETMRMYSPVPFIGRKLEEELEWDIDRGDSRWDILYSNLNYGVPLWDNSSDSYRVFVLQKAVVRLLADVPILAPNGMTIPEDTDIGLFLYDIHQNPELFPEPEKFKPERFEDDYNKYQYKFMPFSAGPRDCIGKMFAKLEMKSVVSKILRNFEVLPSKPERELKLVPKLVLTPTDGCYVSFRKR